MVKLALALILALPCAAQACDQCMGGKDSNLRPAVNGAIFFMLGIVMLMATTIVLCMRGIAKRGNTPLPPHLELMVQMPEGGANHV